MVDLSPNKQPMRLNKISLLLICVVLSIVLMIVWFREGSGGPLHVTRNVVTAIASPFQYAGSFISYPFRAIGNTVRNLTADQTDLKTLERENEELRAEITRLQEFEEENQRLTLLLDIDEAYSLESTGARVISQSSDTWNRMITIDKGTKQGIAVGMPVMSANGLVGQVESVSLLSSTVRLITDEGSGVACILQTSRAEGLLTGSVEGLIYVKYVSTSYSVEVGDAVVTSGLGGTFPKGIVIGEVTDVDKSESDLYYTILVEPITRVSAFEEVLVVTGNATDVALSTQTSNISASSDDTKDDGTAATDGTADESAVKEDATSGG